MENPRPEKVAAVQEVKDRFASSTSVMITEYRGLSVDSISELRRSLRPVGGKYKVYKNTLVRRAAAEAGLDLEDQLIGPTALAFTDIAPDGSEGDVVTIAKILRDFGKTHPELIIKGGYFDGNPIDAEGIHELADVEPMEVLLAKFAGLLQAPMQQFAGLLQALPRNFAYGLQALIEKGGGPDAAADEAPAPVAEAEPVVAEEAPAEEETAEVSAETTEPATAESEETVNEPTETAEETETAESSEEKE